MARLDDYSRRCLVVAGDDARWRTVLDPGVRGASGPEGDSLEPERLDPARATDVSSEGTLDLLEWGACVVADLAGVSPGFFTLLAWHARVRPESVVLLRPGGAALPFELHEFPVRRYGTDDPEEASRSRAAVAKLATLGASARDRLGIAERGISTTAGQRTLRKRRQRTGVSEALRVAARGLLAGDADAALKAVEASCRVETDDPDLHLRAALLHRDAARWPDAERHLKRAVEIDPEWAPAWRELGIVRDRAGKVGAAEALRRAVSLSADYAALVALSYVLSRRGEALDALRCLERASEVAEGQLNLALPTIVLRAGCTGSLEAMGRDRERVLEVMAIRRAEAEASPPVDAPWSSYDVALASLVLGDAEGAARHLRTAKSRTTAPWQAETFARSLDALERAGVATADLRAILSIAARRPSEPPSGGMPSGGTEGAPAHPSGTSRPFKAEAREASWFRKNVPCASACPVGTDAGGYVALAAKGRFDEAYLVARGPNPFASVCGRVCAAPCESACRRGRVDEPVAIRAIKRFVTERHGPESGDSRLADVLSGARAPGMEGPAYASRLKAIGAGQASGRKVAVVGGGPAGLACAHDLAFLGHRVTVFEASDHLGGMMRHGIPDYRLPREVLDAEIAAILDLGVEVRLSCGLDAKRTLRSLVADGFEAVFLASGAGRGRGLDVEGSALDGVVRAIDFLINVNNGFRLDLGRHVVVLGGGNVAIDVARTARLGRPPDVRANGEAGAAEDQFGAALAPGALTGALKGETREVHVVARQPMGEWPAQKSVHGGEEIDAASNEGVVFHPLRGIRRILGDGGRVSAVELAEVVRLKDERGRYSPAYGGHVAETIPCETVLLAVGQEPDLDYLEGTSDLKRTREGFIETVPETLATSVPGVFAGGDAAFGPRTLIDAVSEGKRAAAGMHRFLCGDRRVPLAHTFTEIDPRDARLTEDFDAIPRTEPPVVRLARRTGIAQVDGVYSEAEAVRQASRCLACHVQTVYDGDLCVACGRCTDVCPFGCLSLVPVSEVEAPGSVEGEGGVPAGRPRAAMLKDEDVCIRCGLCAERCPTGAMTMERYDLRVAAAAS